MFKFSFECTNECVYVADETLPTLVYAKFVYKLSYLFKKFTKRYLSYMMILYNLFFF